MESNHGGLCDHCPSTLRDRGYLFQKRLRKSIMGKSFVYFLEHIEHVHLHQFVRFLDLRELQLCLPAFKRVREGQPRRNTTIQAGLGHSRSRRYWIHHEGTISSASWRAL